MLRVGPRSTAAAGVGGAMGDSVAGPRASVCVRWRGLTRGCIGFRGERIGCSAPAVVSSGSGIGRGGCEASPSASPDGVAAMGDCSVLISTESSTLLVSAESVAGTSAPCDVVAAMAGWLAGVSY